MSTENSKTADKWFPPSLTFTLSVLFLCPAQFYRCFLILFHCKHQMTENGHSSMPSKTTAVQLNRRVYESTPAATGHISGSPQYNKDCISPASEKAEPPDPPALPALPDIMP